MQVKPENANIVILAIRWGILIFAGIILFVFEWQSVGFGLVVAGLTFSMAMRVKLFRLWLVGKLTGE